MHEDHQDAMRAFLEKKYGKKCNNSKKPRDILVVPKTWAP